MVKRYRVRLAEEEQQGLRTLVSKGRAAAYKQTHARILLLCDENQADGTMKDDEIARALKVGTATVERVRQRCVEEGLEAALGRRQELNCPRCVRRAVYSVPVYDSLAPASRLNSHPSIVPPPVGLDSLGP